MIRKWKQKKEIKVSIHKNIPKLGCFPTSARLRSLTWPLCIIYLEHVGAQAASPLAPLKAHMCDSVWHVDHSPWIFRLSHSTAQWNHKGIPSCHLASLVSLLLVFVFFYFVVGSTYLFYLYAFNLSFSRSYVSLSFSSWGTPLAALSFVGMSFHRPSLPRPCP